MMENVIVLELKLSTIRSIPTKMVLLRSTFEKPYLINDCFLNNFQKTWYFLAMSNLICLFEVLRFLYAIKWPWFQKTWFLFALCFTIETLIFNNKSFVGYSVQIFIPCYIPSSWQVPKWDAEIILKIVFQS